MRTIHWYCKKTSRCPGVHPANQGFLTYESQSYDSFHPTWSYLSQVYELSIACLFNVTIRCSFWKVSNSTCCCMAVCQMKGVMPVWKGAVHYQYWLWEFFLFGFHLIANVLKPFFLFTERWLETTPANFIGERHWSKVSLFLSSLSSTSEVIAVIFSSLVAEASAQWRTSKRSKHKSQCCTRAGTHRSV